MADRSIRYILQLADQLSGPARDAATAAHEAAEAVDLLTERVRGLQSTIRGLPRHLQAMASGLRGAADGARAMAASGEAGAAAVGAVGAAAGASSAAVRAYAGSVRSGAKALDALAQSGTLSGEAADRAASGARAAAAAADAMAAAASGEAAGLREAAAAADRLTSARDQQRASEKAAAAEAKAAAAAQRQADRERAAATRELQRVLDQAERREKGNIQGRADQETRRIDRIIEQAKAVDVLTDAQERLLRVEQERIQADAQAQRAQIAGRGVAPDLAYGARATRSTTIGAGVLSSYFDRLFGGLDSGGQRMASFSVDLDDLRQKAGQADTALKALAGGIGVVSPAAETAAIAAGDMVGALEYLLTPAGAAAGGLLAVGAAGAGFVAAAVAAVSATAELADGLEELHRLGGPELLSPADAAQVREAADALQAVRVALQAVVAAFAAEVAPAVRSGAETFAAFGLAAAAQVEGVAAGLGSLGSIVRDVGSTIAEGLLTPLRALLDAVRALDGLLVSGMERVGLGESAAAQYLRDEIDGIDRLQRRLDGVVRSVGQAAADAVEGVADRVRSSVEPYRDEARQLIAAVGAQRQAREAGPGGAAGALEDVAGAAVDLDAEMGALAQALAALLPELEAAAVALDLAALDAGTAGLEADLAGLGDSIGGALRSVRLAVAEEALRRATAATSQLMQGNVVGALGQATAAPAIALTGQALGLLAQLGELGTEELRTRGQVFAAAVAEGIRGLPALILDVLPDLAVTLADAVGAALLDLPAALAEAIRQAIRGEGDTSRTATGIGAVVGGVVGGIVAGPGGAAVGAAVGGVAGSAVGNAIERNRDRGAVDALRGGLTLPGAGSAARPKLATAQAPRVQVTIAGPGIPQLLTATDRGGGPYGALVGRRS